jgi:phosphatidylserine decarboxylase
LPGIPFATLFIDLLSTRSGQTFFSQPKVNNHLKNIFNAYQQMLTSEVSLKYLTEEEPYGWFSPAAQARVNWDHHYVDKSEPHWGFKNWNDWFTRQIRPEARPIAAGKNAIVHSSDSFPLYYPPGARGANPTVVQEAESKFWLKDHRYSLLDMFAARQMKLEGFIRDHFVGGTVYQAFLDPWCYHRWHSPVTGTIARSYHVPGAYFVLNPGLMDLDNLSGIEKYANSMPFLTTASTRQIYIIRLEEKPNCYVGVIEVGMAEVSSCQSTVTEGQRVEKGDELGYFQFGGSSYAMVFDRNLILDFEPTVFTVGAEGYYPKQLVNSLLATFH